MGVFKLMDEQGWMVRSKYRPNMFWHVSWDMEDHKIVYLCDCPAGERLDVQTYGTNRCRHVNLVLQAETADGAEPRPAAEVIPGTFVD